MRWESFVKKIVKISPLSDFQFPCPTVKNHTFSNFSLFFLIVVYLITEFQFVLVFHFINHFPLLFYPPPLGQLSICLYNRTRFEIYMKNNFNWQLITIFPRTVVYFPLIYMFREENLPPILIFVKIAPPHGLLMKIEHLESFYFLFICIFNLIFFLFLFQFLVLLTIFSLPSNLSFYVRLVTYITKQILKLLCLYEKQF